MPTFYNPQEVFKRSWIEAEVLKTIYLVALTINCFQLYINLEIDLSSYYLILSPSPPMKIVMKFCSPTCFWVCCISFLVVTQVRKFTFVCIGWQFILYLNNFFKWTSLKDYSGYFYYWYIYMFIYLCWYSSCLFCWKRN